MSIRPGSDEDALHHHPHLQREEDADRSVRRFATG
jgi:hypothetical protein